MPEKTLDVVILAAGLGTRMKSATIKVLHRAAGRPIIDYVLDLACDLCTRPPVVVVGHQKEAVQKAIGGRARFRVQEQPLRPGPAGLQAAPYVAGGGRGPLRCGGAPPPRPAAR